MRKSILTPSQQKILTFLSKDKTFLKYFYLTGGTALAEYYLHHRLSEDLDFFSTTEIDPQWITSLVTQLTKKLPITSVDRREVFNRNLVFFNIGNTTVKTEFTYFPSPQIEVPKITNGIPVDSLTDIATNKFFTIYQKPSARHFIDLYLLLTQKDYLLSDLEKLARIKFDTAIDPIQLGSQLIKANNISDLPHMLIKLPEDKWRKYWLKQAKTLKERIKK
ncbi:MAG: hypothetical protein UU42_C0012G0015 [Candidatus Woesebacteria bacterium GW2011_GWA1_41_13b]|uniref:Nucleotidyl transferase AbiEii/AbiGii toxin family protein n=1 Tax=Candidatus Woesebacteria bacterium GW2011_GWA1_41_13b TaxID=1618555 RepID=A0A0G0URP2_9BACT|nr:MAG: hypothetical protein UU42_C0012G0015 [Candidatus Woesebacteria bacterium GW2011_GWA1_41_13b]